MPDRQLRGRKLTSVGNGPSYFRQPRTLLSLRSYPSRSIEYAVQAGKSLWSQSRQNSKQECSECENDRYTTSAPCLNPYGRCSDYGNRHGAVYGIPAAVFQSADDPDAEICICTDIGASLERSPGGQLPPARCGADYGRPCRGICSSSFRSRGQ